MNYGKIHALNDERIKLYDMLNGAIADWESQLVTNATGVAAELELPHDEERGTIILTWSRFSQTVGWRLGVTFKINGQRNLLVDACVDVKVAAYSAAQELTQLIHDELELAVEALREQIPPLFGARPVTAGSKPKRRLQ